jgi:hypothetical protein
MSNSQFGYVGVGRNQGFFVIVETIDLLTSTRSALPFESFDR